VVKARKYRFGAVGHAVAEKLPGSVVKVVRSVGDRLGTGMNGLRQESPRMGRIRELPIEQATVGIGGSPEIVFGAGHYGIRLHERLAKCFVKASLFGKAILPVWVNGLKNRKIGIALIP
jgi:hypothetical protein